MQKFEWSELYVESSVMGSKTAMVATEKESTWQLTDSYRMLIS
jgi:hypothetical protein